MSVKLIILKYTACIAFSPLIYLNPVSSVFTAVPGSVLIRKIITCQVERRAVQFVMGNSTETDRKVNISLLPAQETNFLVWKKRVSDSKRD